MGVAKLSASYSSCWCSAMRIGMLLINHPGGFLQGHPWIHSISHSLRIAPIASPVTHKAPPPPAHILGLAQAGLTSNAAVALRDELSKDLPGGSAGERTTKATSEIRRLSGGFSRYSWVTCHRGTHMCLLYFIEVSLGGVKSV